MPEVLHEFFDLCGGGEKIASGGSRQKRAWVRFRFLFRLLVDML
jgi:hypothetical protein